MWGSPKKQLSDDFTETVLADGVQGWHVQNDLHVF